MRFVKPLDTETLNKVMQSFDQIVTIEDGSILGGFGSAVLEFMAENGFTNKIKILGIPDKFIEHGTPEELYRECGIDTQGIVNTVKKLVGKTEIV